MSKSQEDIRCIAINKLSDEKLKELHKLKFKPKLDSRNCAYLSFLEAKKNKIINKSQIWENNLKDLNLIKNKVKPRPKFCLPVLEPKESLTPNYREVLFCNCKNNYFVELTRMMRQRYIKDTNHYYSYSNYSLALSFPMFERERNDSYLKYLKNKERWRNGIDFNRYSQPPRENIYFPKINNIL